MTAWPMRSSSAKEYTSFAVKHLTTGIAYRRQLRNKKQAKMGRCSVLVLFVLSLMEISLDAVVQLDGTQRLVFKTPDLSEEEEYSHFLPEHLRCDGCQAVAYQLFLKFDKFNRKEKRRNYDLPESEILDLMEQGCSPETFSNANYGLKEVDGVNRLTGPGLEAEDHPGVVSGGGKWPARLQELCSTFIEEFGEDVIYESYRRNPKNRKALESFLCQGSGISGSCRNRQQPEANSQTLQ